MEPEPWYENAVIYAIDVEMFNDSDGDGVGDFRGLIEKLDYLNRLGVSAVWLLPFYPSPNRDNGYDVVDYYGVDPRQGTLGDVVEFVDEADSRGIRVLIDLVVNHTSDQHPWFQAARSDPDSKYRDYYVWVDDPPPNPERISAFPGEVEKGRVWTYDSEADAYYYHRFYPFQPDLNVTNPAVREEIRTIVKFWLKLGVDGFRVDAATLMVKPKRPDAEVPDDPYELLRTVKHHALAQRSDAVLLAEADDDPAALEAYFDRGGMDLLMNFVLNAHLVAALATGRAAPLVDGLERLPDPRPGRWANFLRNYDELNVGRLPDDLREEVFDLFAPDAEMRIYGRGIRRRLAPMLDGDPDRIKLAFSLLFSLPGTPLILYGDEIGMGENPDLPGRLSVRTPMHWTDERSAGFSSATEDSLVRPVVTEGPFGYDRVNVAAQRVEPDSLLNWTQQLIATRRETHEIGRGPVRVLETSEESVFAHRFDGQGTAVVCAHNLGDEARTVGLDVELAPSDGAYPIFGSATDVRRADGAIELSLEEYGFGWVRIHREEPVA